MIICSVPSCKKKFTPPVEIQFNTFGDFATEVARTKKQIKEKGLRGKEEADALERIVKKVGEENKSRMCKECRERIEKIKNTKEASNRREEKNRHRRENNSLRKKLGNVENELQDTKRDVFNQGEVIFDIQKSIRPLEIRTEKLENNVFSSKEPPKTIYDFDTIWHWIGWPIFLVFSGYVGWKAYKEKHRKKDEKNYLIAIREIFKEWRLNMYASTGGYVVGFFLIQQAIAKWIEPQISNLLITQKIITIVLVSLFVGIGFYLDGIITSSLKTPLQRLSIKIENANIDEKVKKSLLSKTQQVNELFKETLKRFGLLAVVGILTKLIEIYWNKHFLTYLSYGVPIAGGVLIIRDVNKTLKGLKLKK